MVVAELFSETQEVVLETACTNDAVEGADRAKTPSSTMCY